MRDVWQDLKLAGRRLRHSPGFALTAVVSLTMAIAANLVVFGVFNAAVMRQMGIAHADRNRELAARIAIGSSRWRVLRQVLGAAMSRTVLLLIIGSAAGMALGVLGSRVLASIVYEATVYDPVVLILAIAAMVAIGALAALGPARRAMRADPAALLREQ